MLADVEEHLQKLENIYDQSVSEKNELEFNMSRTQARLKRSDLLVVVLSDEQLRWENNIKVLYFCYTFYTNMYYYIIIHAFYIDVVSTPINCNW